MKWRLSLLAVLTCLASTWAGCDYSTTELPPAANSSIATNTEGEQVASSSESSFNDMKPTILESVISLIQTAALKPGGDNSSWPCSS